MEHNAVQPSTIKNKRKREEVYAWQKQQKIKAKLERRLKRKRDEENDPTKTEERRKKNVPRTLENSRELDETIVGDDVEVAADEDTDEFAGYFNRAVPPKIVITTSIKPARACYEFGRELVSVFPNSEFFRRGSKYTIAQICGFCKERGYTDLIVINEDQKMPNGLTLVHLPDGPTAHFRLSGISLTKDIGNHGRHTGHVPELILNNFNTRLGHTIGRMLAALFPQMPEFQGRTVATFHNQRDFIFFRRSRYMFKNKEKVDLQELGPRFTLKLRWLQRGLYDPQHGEYEWKFKPEMETSRRRFFL